MHYLNSGLAAVVLVLSMVSGARCAEIPEVQVSGTAPWQQELKAKVTRLDAELSKAPDKIRILSERGDAHLFLGEGVLAVADFERTIALDPALDAPHWRLGIAYLFAGQADKSSRQFAKYHAYDGHDRENGVWKFFADAEWHGVEKARGEMLEYRQFDREPFPSLYEMLAGRLTDAQFFEDLRQRKVAGDRQALFFADYYAGLNDEAQGRHDSALKRVGTAVALFSAEQAGEGGPGYMWRVARAHLEWLRRRP